MASVIVRRVESFDSMDIFEWRNDSHTRKMSRTSEKVEWAEHSNWFNKTLMQ